MIWYVLNGTSGLDDKITECSFESLIVSGGGLSETLTFDMGVNVDLAWTEIDRRSNALLVSDEGQVWWCGEGRRYAELVTISLIDMLEPHTSVGDNFKIGKSSAYFEADEQFRHNIDHHLKAGKLSMAKFVENVIGVMNMFQSIGQAPSYSAATPGIPLAAAPPIIR